MTEPRLRGQPAPHRSRPAQRVARLDGGPHCGEEQARVGPMMSGAAGASHEVDRLLHRGHVGLCRLWARLRLAGAGWLRASDHVTPAHRSTSMARTARPSMARTKRPCTAGDHRAWSRLPYRGRLRPTRRLTPTMIASPRSGPCTKWSQSANWRIRHHGIRRLDGNHRRPVVYRPRVLGGFQALALTVRPAD
jgi:hypothetical protein